VRARAHATGGAAGWRAGGEKKGLGGALASRPFPRAGMRKHQRLRSHYSASCLAEQLGDTRPQLLAFKRPLEMAREKVVFLAESALVDSSRLAGCLEPLAKCHGQLGVHIGVYFFKREMG
jgi:hypothetical protein